jgi:hypothetical protein
MVFDADRAIDALNDTQKRVIAKCAKHLTTNNEGKSLAYVTALIGSGVVAEQLPPRLRREVRRFLGGRAVSQEEGTITWVSSREDPTKGYTTKQSYKDCLELYSGEVYSVMESVSLQVLYANWG